MKSCHNRFFLGVILISLCILSYSYSAQMRYRKRTQSTSNAYQETKPLLPDKTENRKRKNPPIDVKSMTDLDTYLTSRKPVVLMIHASWCGVCKVTMPTFADAAEDNPHVTFLKVESSEVPGIDKKYPLRGFPTFVLFDAQGKQLGTFSGGGWPKSFLNQKIKEYIK